MHPESSLECNARIKSLDLVWTEPYRTVGVEVFASQYGRQGRIITSFGISVHKRTMEMKRRPMS